MWKGQDILSIQSDVLMGNVSVPETDELTVFPGNGNGHKKRRKEIVPSQEQFHSLFQIFSAKFVYANVVSKNKKDTSLEKHLESSNNVKANQSRKSGNPGYNKGMPLITALYKLEEIKGGKKVNKIRNIFFIALHIYDFVDFVFELSSLRFFVS